MAAQILGKAVIAINGAAFNAVGLTAGELLKRAPRGAYTTARTYLRHNLFELETHITRTAKSCALMLDGEARAVGADVKSLADAARLRPLLLQSVGAAIRGFERAHESDSSDAVARAELKVTLLITWPHGEAAAEATSGSGSWRDVSLAGPSAPTVSSVRDMLAGLGLSASDILAAGDAAPSEADDLLLAQLRGQAAAPFCLLTHVTPLPARRAPPIIVHVAGAPRHNAAAKDSEWVRQRTSLEAAKPAHVEEVLLFDDGSAASEGAVGAVTGAAGAAGAGSTAAAAAAAHSGGPVLEGTQTNVFALLDDGRLYTAGEGILEGTVRRLVLEVCSKGDSSLPEVVLEAPRLADVRGRWIGAFLSSTSRLVLPIDEVWVPKHFWGDDTGDLASADGIDEERGLVCKRFATPRPAALVQLEKAVAAAVEAHSGRVLPEGEAAGAGSA